MPSKSSQQQQNSQRSSQQDHTCLESLISWSQAVLHKTKTRQDLTKTFLELNSAHGSDTVWDSLRGLILFAIKDTKCPFKLYHEYISIITSCCSQIAFQDSIEIPILGMEDEAHYLMTKFLVLMVELSYNRLNDIKMKILYCFDCLSQELIKHNCSINEDLSEKLLFALGELCIDKKSSTRVAAIKVISLMQSDYDPDCCVWKLFHHLIETDGNPAVLISILSSMRVTKYNLQTVLDLVLTDNTNVVSAAVQCLVDKVNPKILKPNQMCQIFKQLVHAKNVKSCMMLREKVFPSWLSSYKGMLSQFIASMSPHESEENDQLVLKTLKIVESLISDDTVFTDFEVHENKVDLSSIDLTPEKSMALYFFALTVGKTKYRTISQNIFPDIDQLINRIKMILVQLDSDLDALEVKKHVFTAKYLIKLLSLYDHSECDVTRAKIDEAITSMVEDYSLSEQGIIYEIIHTLKSIYESDLENFAKRVSSFIDKFLVFAESDKENSLQTKEWDAEPKPTVTDVSSVKDVKKIVLLLANSLIHLFKSDILKTLRPYSETVVLPSFRIDDVEIRKLALKCLFRFCLDDLEYCAANVKFFITGLKKDVVEVQYECIKFCFDLWLFHGKRIFRSSSINVESGPGVNLYDDEDNPESKMVRDFLITFIWNDDNRLQFAAIDAMCKLFIKSELRCPETLASMFIFYCNSLFRSDHLEVYSKLSSFFKMFSAMQHKNKLLLASIALPFHKIIEEAPKDSVLTKKVDLEFAAENLTKFTDEKYVLEYDDGDEENNQSPGQRHMSADKDYFERPHGLILKAVLGKISEDPLNPDLIFLLYLLKNISIPTTEEHMMYFSSNIEDLISRIKLVDGKIILRQILKNLRKSAKMLNMNCMSQPSSQPTSQQTNLDRINESEEEQVEMVDFK